MSGNRLVITEDQKLQAVELAINGGSPCTYLKSLGCKNPSGAWHNIKSLMERTRPDVFAKIPKRTPQQELKLEPGANYEVSVKDAMDNIKDAADEFFDQCIDMGLKVDPPKITAPVSYDGFQVRGISGRFGSYHFQDINGKQWIDYEDNDDANELSMTVEQWRGFLDELHRAALVLGVEL